MNEIVYLPDILYRAYKDNKDKNIRSEGRDDEKIHKICLTKCAWHAWNVPVYSGGYIFYLEGSRGRRNYGSESGASGL